MKPLRISTYIDILFCVVIMPLVLMVAPVEKWIVHHTHFMIILTLYLYGLYFVFRKVSLPTLFMKKKWGYILVLLLTLFATTELISQFPLPPDDRASYSPMTLEIRRDLRKQTVWFFFLIVMGFSLCIEVAFELFRQILLKKEIEMEKKKAELALYKAQINPHFLFNTLNTLYALVLTKSEKTESAFVKFSNILKYMYTHATEDTISLGEEIDYIKQYIDLQLLRLNRHTQIVVRESVTNRDIPLPPMLLITFVENAFKYGTSSETDCTIQISIAQEENALHFETENRVMRENQEQDTAVGMENCRKRLELMYPQHFDLSVREENGLFITHLTLQLV